MSTPYMLPTGNEVKAEGFKHARDSGSVCASRLTVLNALRDNAEPMTRNELEEQCNLPLSSICGRVRELMDLGYVETAGTVRVDKCSRTTVHLTTVGTEYLREQDRLDALERVS